MAPVISSLVETAPIPSGPGTAPPSPSQASVSLFAESFICDSISVHVTWDGALGMAQPRHRVAADIAIALRNIRPVGVLSQPEENTQGTLVRAFSQHHFVAFAECRTSRSSARHVSCISFFRHSLPRPRCYGRNFGLFRSEEHTSELQSRQYLVCPLLL